MAFGTVVTTGSGQGNLLRVENLSGDVGEGWQLGMILVFELGEGITQPVKGSIYPISADSSDPSTIDCTITFSAGLQATGRLSANKQLLTIGTGEWGNNVSQTLPKNVPIAIDPSFTNAMRGTIPSGYSQAPPLSNFAQDTLFTCAVVYNGNANPVWVDFLVPA